MKSEDARFEDDFDKIMRSLKDDRITLSDSLQQRLNRWKSAREWILTMRPLTDSFTVNFLTQTYKVSEGQAWRDVRDTKRFFASMEKANLEYDRIMLVAQIRDLRAKADTAKDYAVAAKCDATLQKMGVGKEADSAETSSKTIELVIGFNPALIGAKPIPNLLAEVSKYLGEEQARRELMIADEDTI